MAKPEKVANRYAKAIFDATRNASELRKLLEELERFAQAVDSHEDLRKVFETEVIAADSRRQVVEDIAKRLGLSERATRILVVISDAKRMSALRAINERVHAMLLESANVALVKVVAATLLSPEEKQKIEQRFNKILGKEVEASYVVDSELIGGLKVTAGSRTFDGTLAGWLATFEEQLVGGTI